MIKFACPGCAEVYSVEDAKAGKSGKCPKCQADFVIPRADSSVPPAPSASSDPSAPPVEIRPCPGCHATLSVNSGDVGKDVECPYCKSTFRAMATKDAARQSGRASDTVEDDRPRKRSDRRERYDDDGGDNRVRRREHESQTVGTVSLVTGIISLPLVCCCGFFSIPLALTAIVTGIFSLKTAGRGMGLAGLIVGSLSLLFSIGMLVLGFGAQLMNIR